MAFREPVLAETLDLLEDGFGKGTLVAARGHAVDDAGVVLLQPALALPGRHRPPQLIGLPGREPGCQHRHLHHLLLEHRHAERAAQRLLQRLARIADRFLALPPVQIWMHHAALDRSGSHDRYLDHQVVEAARPQARQHAHLRAALDLEHADGVGLADHVVGGLVLGRDVLHREGMTLALADEVEALADGGEHAQRQHVDLEQAESIDVVLVPLDDGAVRHGGVLDRHHPRQRPLGQHEATRVLRQVSWQVDQLAGEMHQLSYDQVVERQAEFGDTLGHHTHAVPPAVVLGQRVDGRGIDAQRLADIADGGLRSVADGHRRQRGTATAVLVVQVLDHLLAPLVLEIHVDVGRLIALTRDEALEQHRHACRIDFGHSKAIADHRVRGRAAALAQDVARACEGDDVEHRQEVVLVLQLADELQLVLDLRLDLGWHAVGPASPGPFVGDASQIGSLASPPPAPPRRDTGTSARPARSCSAQSPAASAPAGLQGRFATGASACADAARH